MQREDAPVMITELERIAAKALQRYSDHAWPPCHTGRFRHSLCCEPLSEERSAGNPHATFCGSRRRVTASGHPVLGVKFPGPTRQNLPSEPPPWHVWFAPSFGHP